MSDTTDFDQTDIDFDQIDTRAIAISAHMKADFVINCAAETAALSAVLCRILV